MIATMSDRVKIQVRPYSKKELCAAYGISKKTLQAWLSRAGIYNEQNRYNSILTIAEIETLFATVGHPEPPETP